MSNRENMDTEYEEDVEYRDDAIIGKAFRWSLAAILLLVIAGGTTAYLLTRPEPEPPVRETRLAPVKVREVEEVQPPKVTFTDITDDSGIAFSHNNGATGEKLLPETMGGGMAFLDFDSDGDQDLLLVNSQDWPDDEPSGRTTTSVLYRNDGGRFNDVTEGSGLDASCYGMGLSLIHI